MFRQLSKKILLGIFVALLLLTTPVYAVKKFKISNYAGGHQIWFEAEDYDERSPDTDQFYPVVDADGAFGRAVTRSGGAGGMIRWTFDISTADGRAGTWFFWGRILNPENQSDYMLVEGDPEDAEIPTGPPFPGDTGEPPFVNEDDRIFEEDVGPWWGWAVAGHDEGHTKELQDGENTMYLFHRQGNSTVFWDVFMWSDRSNYVPNYDDYRNARTFVTETASNPSPANGALIQDTWASLNWSPGGSAASHDVYFGENFDDVNAGTGGSFRGNQTINSFFVGLHGHPYPDGLIPENTYYWRIDEVEADGVTKHKGMVWSFFVPTPKADPSAVPTFNCIGIYWSPQDGGSDNVCQVRYRSLGSTSWNEAMPLWYDGREVGGYTAGYRGSIVNLDPGTVYEIELELLKTGTEEELVAETWSEDFPIAKAVYLPVGTTNQTLEITESGSPDGYILYTDSDDGSVIDAGYNRDYCITVNASYIIIRGLDLRGANVYGIRLYDCHDVVIERCDISDFSDIEDDGWGNRGAAIFSLSTGLERIIVQRNIIHNPYSDTNSWSEYRAKYGTYHPRGPTAIGFVNSAGNHVIRYNEIYSDDDHYFDDCMGAGNNNFPNRDSDIYGNYIANCWDDGIEAEDDNCNVRIWGNFIDWTFVKIAIAPTKVGPVYIWRNISGVGCQDNIHSWNEIERGGFLKTDNGGGKVYVFHNTLLQPAPPRGVYYPLGTGRGLGWGGRMLNVMSRNNILHVSNSNYPSIKDSAGVTYHDALADYDYDLFNGHNETYPGAEPNGINDVPIYDPGNGDGEFALDSFSPGYDAGVVLPNFNDNYNGAAPDIGAYEAGSLPMEFGVDAYQ
jgi:hypothetical protein